MVDFYSAPGPKLQYPFETLEQSVVRFLRQFKAGTLYKRTQMNKFFFLQIFWRRFVAEQAAKLNRSDMTVSYLLWLTGCGCLTISSLL